MNTNSLIGSSNLLAGNFTKGFQHDRIRAMIKESVERGGDDLEFDMVRDASDLTLERFEHKPHTSRGKTYYTVGMNLNGYFHEFDRNSRVTKQLDSMPLDQLQERLRTGAYFFVDVGGEMKLVDFQYDADHAFIHTNEQIKGLMKHIGVSPIDALSRRNKHLHGNTQLDTHYLGAPYSAEDMTVEVLNRMIAGGEFQSVIRYVWSPFMKNILSNYELVRLICANGMIGTSNFMNRKVPLLNMWQENMSIANKQTQARVQNMAIKRFDTMSKENASLSTLLQLASHAQKRIEHDDTSISDRDLLIGLRDVVDPRDALMGVYQESVFENANLTSQLAGHLSKMDAWNIATEMSSHTVPKEDSTTFALSRIANDLVFADRDFRRQQKIANPFQSADRAFFGVLQ